MKVKVLKWTKLITSYSKVLNINKKELKRTNSVIGSLNLEEITLLYCGLRFLS